MARIFLPPPSTANLRHYRYRVVLDQQPFFFEYHYNQRTDAWFLNVDDSENNTLLRGIRLVIDSDLLRIYRHKAVPRGKLVVLDQDGNDEEAREEDLFQRVFVAYEEVEA